MSNIKLIVTYLNNKLQIRTKSRTIYHVENFIDVEVLVTTGLTSHKYVVMLCDCKE